MSYTTSISARRRRVARAVAAWALALSLALLGAATAQGAPPANDDLANAATMTGASGSDTGTTAEATVEPGEVTSLALSGVTTGQTVWWKWTATSSGEFTFAAKSTTSMPTIAVWTGTAHPLTQEVASDGGAGAGLDSRVFFPAVDGTTYYVQVGALQPYPPGTFTLTWGPNIVVNDDFANATKLPADGGAISGWNVGATPGLEPGEPSPTPPLGNTVWYSWTPSADGHADLVLGLDFSIAEINVYTGSTLATLALPPVASGGASSLFGGVLSFDVTGGTTYSIQIGTGDSSPGTFLLAWLLTTRPENDDLANATPLAADSFTTSGSTAIATTESSEPTTVTIGGDPRVGSQSVWYRWDPKVSGNVALTVDAPTVNDVSHSPLVQLYQGPATDPTFGSLQVVGTHDATTGDSTDTTRGFVDGKDTYYIQVMSDVVSELDPDFAFTLTAIRNDLFADANVLTGNEGMVAGSTVGGTFPESSEPGATLDIGNTVWYAWKPTASGAASFTVDAGLGSDATAVYTGNSLDGLTRVDSDLDTNPLHLSFNAVAGTTYHVQVGTYFNSPPGTSPPGPFTLDWTLRPPNDDLADAVTIAGATGAVTGTNDGATVENGEVVLLTPSSTSRTVWWKLVAPSTGAIVFDTNGSSFDTVLGVFTGTAHPLTVVASDDDSGLDGDDSRVLIQATAGTTYYVQVGSFASDSTGSIKLNWSSLGLQYVVTTTGDTVNDANCLVSSCTLRQAVNAANAGGGADTIDVPAGSYQLSANLGALVVSKGVTITGAGARTTTILGPVGNRVFDVTSAATPVLIQGVTLSGGTATASNGSFGGNVRNAGDLTLREVTVTNGSAESGGGLSNAGGTMLVDRSTVSGNQALSGGGDSGGIQNWGDGQTHHGALTIRNSTITGNTARLAGGVLSWNDNANTTVVENSTIAFNTATNRGLGGIGGQGTKTVRGSIVAGNTFASRPSNCDTGFTSLGSNLESGTDCGFTAGGDLQSTNPGLGSLGDNGGPTDTLPLAVASPAVDAVAGACPGVDQRNVSRPQGTACDIGAFELVASTQRTITGSVRGASGAIAPGVLVRACLGTSCTDTTSNSDGFFVFSGVAPGTYVVRALPTDPALLAVQANADVTLSSAQGIDLKFSASGASSTPNGPSTFQVTGCVGGSLTYVATADGVVLVNGTVAVADGANNSPVDGVYTIDISSLSAGHPSVLQFDLTITCQTAPTETQTVVLFTDPSGTVVDDGAAGAALAGATVTLLDANGTPIPANDPRLSPATAANPETSDARGAWAWDVAPGTYSVSATKTACGSTTSGPLTVTPTNPVVNVVLHLSCAAPGGGAPPTTPPTTPVTPPVFPPVTPPVGLPDPVAGVNFNVVPISGTVLVNGVVLPTGQQIPFGAIIDATNGIVSITTIGPNGLPQTAYFYGGVFQLLLDPDGVTTLALYGGDFSVCGVTTTKAKVKGTAKRKVQTLAAKTKTASKQVVRALWGTGKGSFRTKGRFSSATVSGTLWYHADRCDGTYTKVNEGVVTVLDFPHKKVLLVRAGHSVLVRPK